MAAGAVYIATKRCADCGTTLDTSVAANVRYCTRDRQRRRALTFLRQALRTIDQPNRLVVFVDARRHIHDAIRELDR